MIIFFSWFLFAILVGALASSKGRSGIGYFFLSIIISPLLGLLVILVAGDNKEAIEKAKVESGAEVKCYFCAELIKREAKICKHCSKPNHSVYHGPWLRIADINGDSCLRGTVAKVGDLIFKYNGAETKGDAGILTGEINKASGEVSLILVRDAEEVEVRIPAGILGVGLAHENRPVEPAVSY